MSDTHDAEHFDRDQHPELAGLFGALDDLAAPPADASLRAGQIQRAALAARGALPAGPVATPWAWSRAASWRVAVAAAAALAIFLGLGADDRLPEPAQRVVSSVADAVGFEVPDGSDRDNEAPDTGESGTTPATPAEPNDTGEPATPATPAEPGNGNGNNGNGNGNGNGADPATPAEHGEPGQPATPATPAAPGNGNMPENPGEQGEGRPETVPGGGQDNAPADRPARGGTDVPGLDVGQDNGQGQPATPGPRN